MTRHIADRQKSANGTRVQRFAEVERRSGPEGSHPAAQELLRRPQQRGKDNRRALEYARIERGVMA